MQGTGLLSLLIWLPIAGGVLTMALGDGRAAVAVWVALVTSVATFIASIPLYTGFNAATNPVFDLTFNTFPGLYYELEQSDKLQGFALVPGSPMMATGRIHGMQVLLTPGHDFIRARRGVSGPTGEGDARHVAHGSVSAAALVEVDQLKVLAPRVERPHVGAAQPDGAV